MSKTGKPRKRFQLSALREATAAKKGGNTIEFETDNGEVFVLPAPNFWDDELLVASKSSGDNPIGFAKILFGGEEEYARFRAAGGRASDLGPLFEAYAEEQGSEMGESSASSSS